MPRRRAISCSHCGYMQLKRDTECDNCGRMTARERNRMWAWGIQVAIVVGVFAVMTAKLQGGGCAIPPPCVCPVANKWSVTLDTQRRSFIYDTEDEALAAAKGATERNWRKGHVPAEGRDGDSRTLALIE